MMARKTRVIRPTVEQARRQFERWRKTRPAFSPIPQALWTLAVKVACQDGVSKTAQALRLSYSALKKHLDSAGGSVHGPQPPPSFVEIMAPPTGSAPCVIEMENAQGAKMKIHWARPEAVDWVALSRGLWGRER
jgi:hypothetical protein